MTIVGYIIMALFCLAFAGIFGWGAIKFSRQGDLLPGVLFTVFSLIMCGITVVWAANFESLTQKPEFKHIIKTDTPALIDTTFAKNGDGTCDTTYTYKFKN